MHIENSTTTHDITGWDDFVAAHPRGSIYHTSRWQDVVRSTFGHPHLYLAARSGAGELTGVLGLVRLKSPMFGHYCVSWPYVNFGGALGESAEVEAALMHEAAAQVSSLSPTHIEFRDLVPRGDEWPVRTDKVLMELELPDSEEAFLKQIGAKLRSQAKRPIREGATAIHGGAELVPEFYRVFSENMRDLGTPVYSKQLFARLMEALPNNATITIVRVGDEPAAAGLTISDGDRMEIPWASALRRFNRISVNMMLYAEVLKRAIQEGRSVFDFGRSTIDAGTYRFKKQWGAAPRQLHWHYWLRDGGEPPVMNPDNPKYALAIKTWTRLPLPIANTLGPHIVKYLP